MYFKAFTAGFILLLVFVTAPAQKLRPDSVIYYSKVQVDSAARSTRTPDKPGRLLAKSKEGESYMVVVRMKPGDVEVHEQFDDVTMIRSGSGVLRTGYKVRGNKASGPKEWLGGIIEDKRDRKIAAGDFFVVPAKLGHQYIPNPGDSLTYIVIKVRHHQNN